jgi:hypothetical protein
MLRWVDPVEDVSMRLKSTLAVIGVAVALGVSSLAPAEAGWCRRAGWCGPETVSHYVYYPNYYNVYYMATFAPDPVPYVYVPRGYWPRYERPYARYGRRYWNGRRSWGCCGGRPAAYYVVPQPIPVPVGGCCGGRYLK